MFWVFLTICLCVEEPVFYCFGSKKECDDYLATVDLRLEYVLQDISNVGVLQGTRPYGGIMFASDKPVSVTIDYRTVNFEKCLLYLLGNKKSQITLKFPDGVTSEAMIMLDINVTMEFEAQNSFFSSVIYLFSSNVESNHDFEVEYLTIDSYSTLIGSFMLNVQGYLTVDASFNLEKLNLSPGVSIERALMTKTNYIKVDTSTMTFYDIDNKLLGAIDIDEEIEYSPPIIYFGQEIKSITIFMADPKKPINQYKKITFASECMYRFNGTFPGNINTNDYIFVFKRRNSIIINSTYVPMRFSEDCNIYFEVMEYTLTKEQRIINQYDPNNFRSNFGCEGDFSNMRITLKINSNSDYIVNIISPNIDFVFNTYQETGYNFQAVFDEKSVNAFTFLDFKSQGRFRVYFAPSLPAYFDDDYLKNWEKPKLVMTSKSVNLYANFQIISSMSFMNSIFSFNIEQTSSGTNVYLVKTGTVPVFMPNIRISDKYCPSVGEICLTPENISKLYDYVKPSYNKSILFETFNVLPDGILNFSKFPAGEEYSYLEIKTDYDEVEIPVTGHLKLNKLNLEKIYLKSVGKTNYDINFLSLEDNSSIFFGDITYKEDVFINTDTQSFPPIPSVIQNIILTPHDGDKFYVTQNSIKIANNIVKIDLRDKNIILSSIGYAFIFVKEGNESITSWNFNKLALYGDYSVTFEFEGNWTNCFFDFIDFTGYDRSVSTTQPNEIKERMFPYVYSQHEKIRYNYYGPTSDLEICLIPDGSSYKCISGDSYSYEDGLNYLSKAECTSMKIHVYPSDQAVFFQSEHLCFESVKIDSGDAPTKARIKFSNFMPQSDLSLENVELIIDTKEKFLLQGRHTNVDIIKSVDVGPCYYYMSDFNKTIYQMFNVEKHSLFYSYFTGKFSDLMFSIFYGPISRQDIYVNEKEDIVISMEKNFFSYYLKSSPKIKMNYYYSKSSYYIGEIIINLKHNIGIDVYSHDVTIPYNLKIFSNRLTGITFFSSFKNVDLYYVDENTKIYINDTSGIEWDNLILRHSLYVDSPCFSIKNITYRESSSNNFNITTSLDYSCINVTDTFTFSQELVLSENIDLNINSLYSNSISNYPFYHSLNENKISKVSINDIMEQSLFLFNYDTVINLCPRFASSQLTDDLIANLKNPISIVTTKNLLSDYSNMHKFIDSNVVGFSDKISIVSITHDANNINFVVDKSLNSLKIDLCFSTTSGEACPEESIAIDALTIDKINEVSSSFAVININIMDQNVVINLDFDSSNKIINFINKKEEKCKATIEKLAGIIEFSFDNFNLSSSIDFNQNIPSRYINCALSTEMNQNWGVVESDVYSLSHMTYANNIRQLKIDYATKIVEYVQLGNKLVINGNIIDFNQMPTITLYQNSLTNGMKLMLYDQISLIIRISSDLKLKISGNLTEISSIGSIGKGILTCDVTPKTKDFTININMMNVVKNLIEPVTKTFCIGGNSQSCEVVPVDEIGNKIKNEFSSDFIKVLINNDDVPEFSTSNLMGKNIIITSESTLKKIKINVDQNTDTFILSANNILINLTTPSSEIYFYELSLRNSKIEAKSESIVYIRYRDFISFDMSYMINSNCPAIKDSENLVHQPGNSDSEALKVAITLNTYEIELNIEEDSEIHVTTKDWKHSFADKQGLVMFEIAFQNAQNCLVFQSTTNSFLNLHYSSSMSIDYILFDFRLENSSLTTSSGFAIVTTYPHSIYLENNIRTKQMSYIDFDYPVNIYNLQESRYSVTIMYGMNYYSKGIFELRTGNIDLVLNSVIDHSSVEGYFPAVLTIDEKGVSTVEIRDVGDDMFTVIPLRIGFKSQPSDLEFMKTDQKLVFYDSYSPNPSNKALKLMYDQKFHGFYEEDQIFDLKSYSNSSHINMTLKFESTIKETPMKMCIGPEDECPSDSIAINSDFSVSDFIPYQLVTLKILVASENRKIGMTVDSELLSISITSITPGLIRKLTLDKVVLNIKSLQLNGLNITSNSECSCSFSDFSVHGCSIGLTVFNFLTSFSASLDYDVFKIMKYNEKMIKLSINKCSANTITFMDDGWQFDDLTKINVIDLELSFQGMNKNEVLLKIAEGNQICHGLAILGDIRQVRCYGSDWRTASIDKGIVWDHGVSDVKVVSDTYFIPITLRGSGTVIEEHKPMPDAIFFCFYETNSLKSQCTADSSNQYSLKDFEKTLSGFTKVNIKIEIVASSESKEVAAPTDIFIDNFIDISAKIQIITLSVNLTDNLKINQLNLSKINLKFIGESQAQITIGDAEFINAELIYDTKMFNLQFDNLVTDSNKIPVAFSLISRCSINYVESFSVSSITSIAVNKIQIEFNGIEKDLSIHASKDSELSVNGKVSITGAPDIIFNDLTDTDKALTLSSEVGVICSNYISLNMKGRCSLSFDSSWDPNAIIDINMKGTITGAKKLAAVKAIGPINFILSDDLSIDSLSTSTNISFECSQRRKVTVKEIIIQENAFVEILSDLISLDTTKFSTDQSSFDVFPVTFSVTQSSVSTFKAQTIGFAFNKIQITSILTTVANPVEQTKQMISAQFTNQLDNVKIILLSEKRYLGYWNETCALDLSTSPSSIALIYNDFSYKTLVLCFSGTCDGGPIVTADDYLSMIPPGHKFIEIHLSEQIAIDLPAIDYEKVSVIGPDSTTTSLMLSPLTINNLALKNIKLSKIEIPTGQATFNLVLTNCEVTEITGSSNSHTIVTDLATLKKLTSNSIKIITIKELSDDLTIIFNEQSIIIDQYALGTDSGSDITIYYSQNEGDLALNAANGLKTIGYKFSLRIATNTKIMLGGEWHSVLSSMFFVFHGSNTLNVESVTSFSDPFVYIGDGVVAKKYKERGNVVVCACNGECTSCPQGSKIFNTFDLATDEIKKLTGEGSSLTVHVGNSNENMKLELDFSSSIVPALTVMSLEENKEQFVSITQNMNRRFDKLSLDHIKATSTGSIRVSYLSIKVSTLLATSVEATKASIDTTSIGSSSIYVIESISIDSGFKSVLFGETSTKFDDTFTVSHVATTRFILQFKDSDNSLSLSQTEYASQLSASVSVFAASRVVLDLAVKIDITFDSNTCIEFMQDFNGQMICKSGADIKTNSIVSINGKVTLNGESSIESQSWSSASVSFSELEIKGSAPVKLSSQLTVSIEKLTIDINRNSFPFIYTLYGKCATVSINEMNSNTATIISLVASTFNDVSGLLSSDSPIINIKQQKAADYTITWVNTDDHKHGMWNGNSIFTVKTEGETISLHPLYDSLDKLPAEICISDSPCSSKKAVQVLSSEQIDFSLFPANPKSLKISLEIEQTYTINQNIPIYISEGELLEITGKKEEMTSLTILSSFQVNRYQKVNIKNIKITSSSLFKVAYSNLTFSGVSFNRNTKLDFEGSIVSTDYDIFSSSKFQYTGNEAKSTSINNIPAVLSIKSANGRYPYISTQIKSESFIWNGPCSISSINFQYDQDYVKSQGKISFVLNNDATIRISQFTGVQTDFKTNMVFDVRTHRVSLSGISFIPSSLFTSTDNVMLDQSPGPFPQIFVVQGEKQPDGSIIATGDVRPPKHENIILQGKDQQEGKDLVIENLIIESGTNVHSQSLVILKMIKISGDSSLVPSDNGKIDLKEKEKVEIILNSEGLSLPYIDIGNVGAEYSLTPKSLEINLNLTDVSSDEINRVYGTGKTLISGSTLNCDEWIAKTISEKIVGADNFIFDFVCDDSNSRLLDGLSARRNLVLKASPTSTPKSNTVLIIVIVVIVVVVIVIVVVVVCVVKRKNGRSSSLSESNSCSHEERLSHSESKESKNHQGLDDL